MTIGPWLSTLVSVGSEALGGPAVGLSEALVRLGGEISSELRDLLNVKNGFYAFERALHIFPSGAAASELTLELWNEPNLWRREYGRLAEGALFFAEDAFGGQFCLSSDTVCRFDPETADIAFMASSIEEWAKLLLNDYRTVTGYPLLHSWQIEHGELPAGTRLFAKYPFALGGDFKLSNLRCVDAVAGMRFLGSIATQVHHLPDRAKVRIAITE